MNLILENNPFDLNVWRHSQQGSAQALGQCSSKIIQIVTPLGQHPMKKIKISKMVLLSEPSFFEGNVCLCPYLSKR